MNNRILMYDEEELDMLYEDGFIDECGNWIDHSTTIGYRNGPGTYQTGLGWSYISRILDTPLNR